MASAGDSFGRSLTASVRELDGAWESHEVATLVCPECGFDHCRVGVPFNADGEDSYSVSWGGRGDLLIVPVEGECGSEWQLCFGFHKGQTAAFVRVRSSCKVSSERWVYFIEAVNLNKIKIGVSRNPEARLRQLQTGSPAKLELLHKVRGGSEIESQFHKRFAGDRTRGEWFEASQDLRDLVSGVSV